MPTVFPSLQAFPKPVIPAFQRLSSTPNVEVDLNGDDYIDFKDFTVLADHWLEDAGW